MSDHRQVGQNSIDMVSESAGAVAGWAGGVVFDGPAVDAGDGLADRGAGDRQAQFDGSADGVRDEVSSLQYGSWL